MKQHEKPCRECPWKRESAPGWVGNISPEEWVALAKGEALVGCHVCAGECAGVAIFRANIAKLTRQATLRLPSDRKTVFANGDEFTRHHNSMGFTSAGLAKQKEKR